MKWIDDLFVPTEGGGRGKMLERLSAARSLFLSEERGASSIEYALALGLISLAALAAFQILGDSVSSMFGAVNSDFASAMPGR